MSLQQATVPAGGMATAAVVGGFFLGLWVLNRLLSPRTPPPLAGAPPCHPVFGHGFPD